MRRRNSHPVQRLSGQRGQLSIFVALIFQVLFVLFAMAINVALVVHDKINLQNAVDLAAYYAAQRQAELLNAIAHNNYQIRQSWKLLAWRYRVLGAVGIQQAPYAHPALTGEIAEELYTAGFDTSGGGLITDPPVCVSHSVIWRNVDPQQNVCNRTDLAIPPLPRMQIAIGFPFNIIAAQRVDQLVDVFQSQCSNHGAYNWWFAATILHAFREEQRNRRALIRSLAQGLSSSRDEIVDLRGESTYEGAFNTFIKNLTNTNRQGSPTFELYNSLGHPSLSGRPSEDTWLVPIFIHPTLRYTDVEADVPNVVSGCNAIIKPLGEIPERTDAQNTLWSPTVLGRLDDGGVLRQWYESGKNDSIFNPDFFMSLGVEKNPWYMAYVGVKATSQPRQIFFPFGPRITVTARAYAKPFGGRIGPWYSAFWPSGGSRSQGAQVDRLLPPRVNENGFMEDDQDPARLPNYSRFPGDPLGLKSKGALNSQRNFIRNPQVAHHDYYRNISATFALGQPNDTLAWDGINDGAPEVRSFEIGAIVPDIFDITYYSIEPNYRANYLVFLRANRNALGIPQDLPLRGDLGSRGSEDLTVMGQFEGTSSFNLHQDHAFFFIRNIYHVLTAWLPNLVDNWFQDQDPHFGKCDTPVDPDHNFHLPGECLTFGGRTGYSVKLVARDFLLRDDLPFGGGYNSTHRGPILNPPPTEEGW